MGGTRGRSGADSTLEDLDRALSVAREQLDALRLEASRRRVMDRIAADDQVAYSVAEAAEIMGLGERTVWELIRKPDDPDAKPEMDSFKVGKSRRIARDAILAFVKAKQEAAA